MYAFGRALVCSPRNDCRVTAVLVLVPGFRIRRTPFPRPAGQKEVVLMMPSSRLSYTCSNLELGYDHIIAFLLKIPFWLEHRSGQPGLRCAVAATEQLAMLFLLLLLSLAEGSLTSSRRALALIVAC